MKFPTSHKKIERAYKHIRDIALLLRQFSERDVHTIVIDNYPQTGQNFLHVEFREELFPTDECALVIGDALHNLRSALDFMWYQFVSNPTKWTRFPIFDTRQDLERILNSALEQEQIVKLDRDFVVDNVKPYQGGNNLLWALHDMNIRDKHHLFIPVLKLMQVFDVRLEDENACAVGPKGFAHHTSFRYEITDALNRKVTVKSKGRPAARIFFGKDTPFIDQSVIPTLFRIAEEVTRTVEAFELPGAPGSRPFFGR